MNNIGIRLTAVALLGFTTAMGAVILDIAPYSNFFFSAGISLFFGAAAIFFIYVIITGVTP
jgi:hypothetical protein